MCDSFLSRQPDKSQNYNVQHSHDGNKKKSSDKLLFVHFSSKTDLMRSQDTFWVIKISMGFCFLIVCYFLFNMYNMWILLITNKKPMLQELKVNHFNNKYKWFSLFLYRAEIVNMKVPLIHTFGNSCWRRIDDVLHPTISFHLVK